MKVTRAENIAWTAAGVALFGLALSFLILLTDRASYDGPPVGTIVSMAVALTVLLAAGISGLILMGMRQLANQQAGASS